MEGNTAAAVLDEASALMEEEADWLTGIAETLSEKTGWNIAAVTVNSLSKDEEAACEEYFTAYASGKDGICCLTDIASGEAVFLAEGEAGDYFDDGRIGEIEKEAEEAALKEDYAQSLYLMLLRAEEAYDAGLLPKQETGKRIGIFAGTVIVVLLVMALLFRIRRRNCGAGKNNENSCRNS